MLEEFGHAKPSIERRKRWGDKDWPEDVEAWLEKSSILFKIYLKIFFSS